MVAAGHSSRVRLNRGDPTADRDPEVMSELAHIARSIGAFEVRALGHVPYSTIHTANSVALGGFTIVLAIGAAMYLTIGRRRV